MKRMTAEDANTIQSVDWNDTLCPICMEHPHNAVILHCSSYKKGCRSYVCDTTHMHSNCLDRFAEQSGSLNNSVPMPSSSNWITTGDFSGADLDVIDGIEPFYPSVNRNLIEDDIVTFRAAIIDDFNQYAHLPGEELLEQDYTEAPLGREASDASITCPLCRGLVTGWEIAVEGRKYLNLLKRSCSYDGCSFLGNYRELRQHAWNDHFGISPVYVDTTRDQTWHRLAQQREHDDIISALHSETPEAVVRGDYVIERDNRHLDEDADAVDQPWEDTSYILHMINSAHPESSSRQRPWSRHRLFSTSEHISTSVEPSDRSRLLWGANLLGLQDDEDNIELGDTSNVSAPDDVDNDQSPARR